MPSITFAPYTIRFRSPNGPDANWTPLRDMAGRPLADLLSQCLASHSTLSEYGDQSLMRVTRLDATSTVVKGMVATGDYGYEADLIDAATGAITHQRSTSEAELLPFFFLFEVLPDSQAAIVLLQRFKVYGIRTALLNTVVQDLHGLLPKWDIQINPIINPLDWDVILRQGVLKAARFVSYRGSNDIADALKNSGVPRDDDPASTEVVYRAGRTRSLNGLWDRVRDVISGTRSLREFASIPDFTYDTVKVEIKLNGRLFTVDLGNPMAPGHIDISTQVLIGPNGHPTYESLVHAADLTLDGVRESVRQMP